MVIYAIIATCIAVVLLCVLSFRRFEFEAKDFHDVALKASKINEDADGIAKLVSANRLSTLLVYRCKSLERGDPEIDDIADDIRATVLRIRLMTMVSFPLVILGVFKQTTLRYIVTVTGDYNKLRQLASDLCIIVEPDNLTTLEAALR